MGTDRLEDLAAYVTTGPSIQRSAFTQSAGQGAFVSEHQVNMVPEPFGRVRRLTVQFSCSRAKKDSTSSNGM
jgi:hypothetical protein